MGDSLFEKIARRELPGYIVWENKTHIAFLTIEPLAPGHTLVVPKVNPGDNIFHLTDEQYHELMFAAKDVAEVLEEKLGVNRIMQFVVGEEVPHVHVHLVPYVEGFSLTEMNPQPASQDELEQMQQRIVK